MSLVQDNLLRLALRVSATTKSGKRFRSTTNNSIPILSSSSTSPIVIATTVAHGLSTGDIVTVYGHATNTTANNTAANPAWTIIVTAPTTFSLTGSVYTAGGGVTGIVTPFMVGSVDGARFTRQRLLDIYNEARMALFNALYESKSLQEIDKYVYGLVTTASAAITYSAPYKNIPKPTGFLRLINLVDGATTPQKIDILPTLLLDDARKRIVPSVTTSATHLLAFDVGQNWSIIGNYGTTPASITYYGIISWVWATDILPNTTVESFSPDIEPILIEIAEAIANEQSNFNVVSLAKTLLNKGR